MPQYLCYIATICSYKKSMKCDSQSRRFRELIIIFSHPLHRGLKHLKQPTCLQTNAVHLEYFQSLASALHKLLLLFYLSEIDLFYGSAVCCEITRSTNRATTTNHRLSRLSSGPKFITYQLFLQVHRYLNIRAKAILSM